MIAATGTSENQPETVPAPENEEKPKPKRGRKPGSKNKSSVEKEQPQVSNDIENTIPEQTEASPAMPDNAELPELNMDEGDDFIAIEDLPSEKIELPTELLGKFEATKMEQPIVPDKDNKSNNNRYQSRQQRHNNRQANGRPNQPTQASADTPRSNSSGTRSRNSQTSRKTLRI